MPLSPWGPWGSAPPPKEPCHPLKQIFPENAMACSVFSSDPPLRISAFASNGLLGPPLLPLHFRSLIAQQRDRQIEEDSRRRENEERVAQYNYFAPARASNRSVWARAGMGY